MAFSITGLQDPGNIDAQRSNNCDYTTNTLANAATLNFSSPFEILVNGVVQDEQAHMVSLEG